ncbi:hypothetical protein RIF23_19920, partial [Lipingzhangella sp. LS1_29]
SRRRVEEQRPAGQGTRTGQHILHSADGGYPPLGGRNGLAPQGWRAVGLSGAAQSAGRSAGTRSTSVVHVIRGGGIGAAVVDCLAYGTM